MLPMLQRLVSGPRRVRTLFLSDIHLGTKGCQADKLLDFMRHYEADTIYLVGDIVDGWQLKSSWYWPQAHNDIVQKFLRKARKGACLFYIPGNHDEFLRDYYGTHFGGIEVVEDAIHVGMDGRRYLVIHGDLFDVVIRHARWLALLGNHAYDVAIWLNTYFNAMRRALGLTYWSLSQWAKLKVKNAVNFIGEYERALALEARRRGVDGVICGQISCTAVVEKLSGGQCPHRLRGIRSRSRSRKQVVADSGLAAVHPRRLGTSAATSFQGGTEEYETVRASGSSGLVGAAPPKGRCPCHTSVMGLSYPSRAWPIRARTRIDELPVTWSPHVRPHSDCRG